MRHVAVTKALRELVLDRTLVDVVATTGRDLLGRADALVAWREARLRANVWTWSRALEGPIGPRVTLRNPAGIAVHGLNFACHDPLALSGHPAIVEAALQAVRQHGLQTPGSPCGAGEGVLVRALEEAVAEHLQLEHVAVFPSGWAAGCATIAALVRPDDHVVVDAYAHPALRQSARAATSHVHQHAHAAVAEVRDLLRAIRAADPAHGILVVTESFFPLESDTPDLMTLQTLCHEEGATLLVAVGYDLGASGPRGTGQLGLQGMLGAVDLVVGSLAKTLAADGGFVATHSAGTCQLVRIGASACPAANGLAPPRAAAALEALRIVGSPEGDELRRELARAVHGLRSALDGGGIRCLGEPSALVPVWVGEESTARLAEALAADHGVLVAVAEDPVVPRGAARLVLHVGASHRPDHVGEAAATIEQALGAARAMLRAADGVT